MDNEIKIACDSKVLIKAELENPIAVVREILPGGIEISTLIAPTDIVKKCEIGKIEVEESDGSNRDDS